MSPAWTVMRSVEQAAARLGVCVVLSSSELHAYAEERLAHLATCAEEPGYPEAVEAEAAALSLHAIGRSINMADVADRELVGFLGDLLKAGVLLL